MVVFALFIISKAGGLIYNREFHTGLSKLEANDYLIVAGTFHGIHAITKQLCPAPPAPGNPATSAPSLAPSPFPSRPSGLEVLETQNFRMQCFQTQTGVKFLLFTEPHQPNIDSMMRRIYELYADFVMKNPFYTVEMPIRCEKFDRGLDGFVKDVDGDDFSNIEFQLVRFEDGSDYRMLVKKRRRRVDSSSLA